jgi:hypothetical protein
MYYDADGNLIDEEMMGAGYLTPQPYDGYSDINDMGEVARLQQIYNTRPDLQQQWADATVGRPWETHPFDGNPLQFIKWADEQEAMQAANAPATGPDAPRAVTQQDIIGQIDQTPLAVYGQQDQARDYALADDRAFEINAANERDLAARTALATTQGQYLTNLARQYGTDATARATADRGASIGRLNDYTSGQRALIEGDAARRYLETDQARDTRMGELSRYIGAWDDNARVARDRSVDQVFSRGGVTGRLGQTQRGVAQVNEDYARERATTEAQGRRGITDDYLTQKYGVGDWRYGQLGDLNQYGFQAGEGVYNTANNRINQVSDAVYGDTRGAAGDAFADVGRAYDLYSTGDLNNTASRYSSYLQANNNSSQDRRQAYQDFTNYLSGQETAGRNAQTNQVNAGQNLVSEQTRFNSDAASARASGQLAGADAWATGLNNAANSVGDYWAKRRGSSRGGYNPSSYNPQLMSYLQPTAKSLIANNREVF